MKGSILKKVDILKKVLTNPIIRVLIIILPQEIVCPKTSTIQSKYKKKDQSMKSSMDKDSFL